MLRKAAEIVLQDWELCLCPVQVFKLARVLAPFDNLLEECLCPMCVGVQAARFAWIVAAHPELLTSFHRSGASAMYGPGEKRDEELIGPFC